MSRGERFSLPILANKIAGMHETIVEATLYGNGLIGGNQLAIFTTWPGLDKGFSTVVLQHELVAVNLSDRAFDRDKAGRWHGRDRNRCHRCHLRRWPHQFHGTGATCCTDSKCNDCGENRQRKTAAVLVWWMGRCRSRIDMLVSLIFSVHFSAPFE